MARILITDGHPLFRDALRQVLEDGFAENEIVEAGNLDQAKEVIEGDEELDLILLDIQIPGTVGYSALIELRNLAPATPIAIVSGSTDSSVVDKVLKYGAAGFISKAHSRDSLLEAICIVLSGNVYWPDQDNKGEAKQTSCGCVDPKRAQRSDRLTGAELRVLQLLAEGKPNKIIAFELGIKEPTVKAHISAILRKLRVFSRTQAVLMAREIDFRV